MAKSEDHPDRTGDKADLYTIIKRRRRSVADYVREQGVSTKRELNALLKTLDEKYLLSEAFLKECETLFIDRVENVSTKPEPEKPASTEGKTKSRTTSKKKTNKTTSSDVTGKDS